MDTSAYSHMRTVRFQPYLAGKGPRFTLHLYDANEVTSEGRNVVAYVLKMGRDVVFEGADFYPSPYESIDGDGVVRGLMSFLTCKPGDTDEEYFAKYTPEQLAYCDAHAEPLSCAVLDRFGED